MIKTKFVLIFGMLIFISSAAGGEVLCGKDSPSGVLYTTKSGKCWSYTCEKGKAAYKSRAEESKCGGIKQCKEGDKKVFTVSGKKCERTCCNGKWNSCNKKCIQRGCDKNKCWNGKECEEKPSEYKEVKGRCEYVYSCKDFSCGADGWVCKGKEQKKVINHNAYIQKGEWDEEKAIKAANGMKLVSMSPEIKCSEDIKTSGGMAATEACVKHISKLMKKSVAEIKKSNITFNGGCYLKESNGDYKYLKCSIEQEECK